jgi:protein-disulfide isomerase
VTAETHRPPERRWRAAVLAGLLLVVVLVVVGTALAIRGGTPPRRANAATTASATQRIDALLGGIPQGGDALGSATAPVTLQFFGDLQCPTSRAFVLGALPFLVRQWVRPGRLRIEFRSLRTATREPSVFTAQQVAALAAGLQNRLWYYIELFYHQQGAEDSGYVTEGFLRDLAEQTPGLNTTVWKEDRFDPLLPAEVDSDVRTARRDRINSTPSFLIGRTATPLSRLSGFSTLEPQAFNVAVQRALAQPGGATFARTHGPIAQAAFAHVASNNEGVDDARTTC